MPSVDVHESRFETLQSNKEMMSKYRKTDKSLNIGTMKARSELFE